VESRATLVRELSDMASAEEAFLNKLAQEPAEASKLAAAYASDGAFVYAAYAKVEVAFRLRFGKSMPEAPWVKRRCTAPWASTIGAAWTWPSTRISRKACGCSNISRKITSRFSPSARP